MYGFKPSGKQAPLPPSRQYRHTTGVRITGAVRTPAAAIFASLLHQTPFACCRRHRHLATFASTALLPPPPLIGPAPSHPVRRSYRRSHRLSCRHQHCRRRQQRQHRRSDMSKIIRSGWSDHVTPLPWFHSESHRGATKPLQDMCATCASECPNLSGHVSAVTFRAYVMPTWPTRICSVGNVPETSRTQEQGTTVVRPT